MKEICISEIKLNDQTLKLGKNNDLEYVRLSFQNQTCEENFMSTSHIVIQNGKVKSSKCKGSHKLNLHRTTLA